MTAYVEEATNDAIASAHHDDRLLGNCRDKVVAGMREPSRPSHAVPQAPEDRLLLGREDIGGGVVLARERARTLLK